MPRSRKLLFFLLLTGCFVIDFAGEALADDAPLILRNNMGVVGMIDMPSARVAPEGQLAFGLSYLKNIQMYNFDFQVLPWLDGSFLYSGLTHYNPSYPVYWDRAFSFKARLFQETDLTPALAIGVNDGVGTGIYSGEYLVASKQFGTIDATLGLGWGRLGSANSFTNPLGLISKSLEVRTNPDVAGALTAEYFKGPAALFGGLVWDTPLDHVRLIGEYSSDAYPLESENGTFKPRNQFNFGVSYQPFDFMTLGLNWMYGETLDARASFTIDPTTSPFKTRMGPQLPPVHVRTEQEQQQALNNLLDQRNGVLHAIAVAAQNRNALVDALWKDVPDLDGVTIQGRYLEVDSKNANPRQLCQDVASLLGQYDLEVAGVVARAGSQLQSCNVHALVHPAIFDASTRELTGVDIAPPSLLTIDAVGPKTLSQGQIIDLIRADIVKQEIGVQAVSVTDSEAVVYYTNSRYQNEKDAIDRLVRVLMQDAPPPIEKFRLITVLNGVPQNEYDVLRSPTERDITQTGRFSLFADGNTVISPPMQNPILAQATPQNYPAFSYVVFPQFRQEFFDPDNPFAVQFLAGAQGSVEFLPGLNLVGEAELNIWDNFNTARLPDSVLPHVRTDWAKFFTEGKNGIGELDLQYYFRLAPDVFAMLKGGYLESMYGGVGGEVLWRPESQRWAFGVDLYDVRERAFDRLFGFQSYHAVTGHVSLYYDSPWYGLNFQVSAGQYLAQDRGITFQVSRIFPETGIEIGIFATKTNVSAAQFGEGSFDKGFIINIPIGWTLPVNTQATLDTVLRPVQRDGGQRLDGDAVLYDAQRRTNYGTITNSSDIVVP